MEISGNTAFYAGLSSIQSGQNRVDQAASQIAASQTVERSVASQSSPTQSTVCLPSTAASNQTWRAIWST